MALYVQDEEAEDLDVQHLVSGMAEADPSGNSGPLPRFVSAPDNRDFFYLLRRE